MSQDKVSVIIRTFNRPRMLRRALESVAAQTWPAVEVMLINDGGASVQDLVDEFAGRLDLHYLDYAPENKPGRSRAANLAIEAATGAWICYLDDDDVWYPDHVESLMAAAAASGAKVVYSDAMKGIEEPDGAGGYVVTRLENGPSEDFSRAGFYLGCYIHLSTFCHRRELYATYGGFDVELDVLEDLDLFFRYAFDHHFHHLRRYTAQFHVRTDQSNAITSMRKEFSETNEMLCKKYLHTAIGDIMRMLLDGRGQLLAAGARAEELAARVVDLEARIARLEARGA
ncbi:MAG: glycosyltransferase [Planctomycetes bacterium]|nr:glycosyltransferase [Planctomycetota bacterium]